MSHKVIQVEGLAAPVRFEKSIKAKRVSITVKPFDGVRVAVPTRLSFKDAVRFFQDNLAWVKKSIEHIKKRERVSEAQSKDVAIDRQKAKEKLIGRLEHLAEKHQFKFGRVFVRNQKTRWGSCSEKNNINLNVNLVKLTDELMDYVLLHELLHTRIKNHSRRFWAELDRYVGDSKGLDRQLKKYLL